MIIALTTSGDTLTSPLNTTFGRAPKFLVYDTDTGAFNVIDNQQNLNSAQGAGIQSAQTVSKSGAQCLISGHCGPKAFRVLAASGIHVYYSDAQTVADALQLYRNGALKQAQSADVEGHSA
ncbi:MAG: dinitrogenase iron-molybdenum cofactor biosynthesis protein [Oxalobacter sp.]|nr:MAG: dinitrogenase iron-molybdenum cofactor biosynthesis protein [Oxalobacter sp.]